jgi:hypothetical protein
MRTRLLTLLARATYTYPWVFVLAGIAVAATSLALTEARLGFETSRNALISPDKEYLRIYNDYKDEFGQRDELVIVVDEPDLRRSKAFARDLATRLEADPAAARKVFYRVDPDALDGRALMYLSAEDLDDMRRKLAENADVIDAIADEPSLERLLRSINREISQAMVGHLVSSLLGTEDEEDDDATAMDLSVLQAVIDAIGEAAGGAPPASIWRGALRPDGAMSENGYIVDDDKRLLFILVQTPEDSTRLASSAEALERVREHVAAARELHPGLRVGITGGPALETEEMEVTVVDMRLASVLALAGVGFCFMLFYREIARPLLAVFTLTLGLAWSFGFITLAIGHLTILSVAFATILIGMSDDFGVHLISRFEEELEQGQPVDEALRRTFVHCGGGIIAGAVTFAIAFLAMALTDFRGIAELGVIGGVGMLLCLVAMLTVFPALLVLHERFKATGLGGRLNAALSLGRGARSWRGAVFRRLYRAPGLLLALSAALSVASLLALPRLGFDLNLLHLQAEGTESVEWEHRILASGSRSSRYAVSVADSLEEARRRESEFERLAVVKKVESAASVVPENQPERMRAVTALAPVVSALPPVGAVDGEVDIAQIHGILQSIRFKLQDPEKRWNPDRKPSDEALRSVRQSIARVEPLVGGGDPGALEPAMARLQIAAFEDLSEEIDFLGRNTRAAPIALDDLPEVLRDRFVGRSGKFLVRVFPAADIWDPENLAAFVGALRSVDPNVTGPPVAFFETSRLMKEGYLRAGLYALVAICLLVLYDFRRFAPAGLALLPLAVGTLWTIGVMGLLGLQFNLANLIILPLIIGIGVSSGIHILHRHLEEGPDAGPVMARSTGRAVVLSSITTALGFGALTVANHQGIHSLGLLLTIGVSCNLLAAVLVLPSILALDRRAR